MRGQIAEPPKLGHDHKKKFSGAHFNMYFISDSVNSGSIHYCLKIPSPLKCMSHKSQFKKNEMVKTLKSHPVELG